MAGVEAEFASTPFLRSAGAAKQRGKQDLPASQLWGTLKR
jgi:hypothetical protein